ncbi:hypothetical protein KY317_01650 [Candidatus Woesearchaeota archaeon]|nr:hypothetical protein [Candidatus Woesearchaeota archaeon]
MENNTGGKTGEEHYMNLRILRQKDNPFVEGGEFKKDAAAEFLTYFEVCKRESCYILFGIYVGANFRFKRHASEEAIALKVLRAGEGEVEKIIDNLVGEYVRESAYIKKVREDDAALPVRNKERGDSLYSPLNLEEWISFNHSLKVQNPEIYKLNFGTGN